MFKAPGSLFMVLAGLLLAITLAPIVQNWDVPVSLHVWDRQFSDISMGSVLLATSTLSAVAMTCLAWARMQTLGRRNQRSSRELERKDVSTEAAQNRIQILEGQVATLEEALKRALATQYPQS